MFFYGFYDKLLKITDLGDFDLKTFSKDIIKLGLKVLLILSISAVAIVFKDELTNIDVRALVASAPSPVIAYLTVLGVYFLKGIVFIIPASLIYVSVGMAFSPAVAVTVNLLGIAVEVTVSYIIGKFLGGDYVCKLLNKNSGGKKLLELKDKNKQSSIFIVRLLPVFPIDFSSLFFGSIGFSFLKYLAVSIIGIAPRVILFTVLGDTIYDYFPMKLILKIIIFSLPFVALGTVVKWIVSQKNRKT